MYYLHLKVPSLADSLLCCLACCSLAVYSINFYLFYFGWISLPLQPASTQMGCPTFGGPYGVPLLVQSLPQILQEFLGTFLWWTNSITPSGTDDLQLRLLLREDIKPRGNPQTNLAQKGERFPLLPFRGILPFFSFLFSALPWSNPSTLQTTEDLWPGRLPGVL